MGSIYSRVVSEWECEGEWKKLLFCPPLSLITKSHRLTTHHWLSYDFKTSDLTFDLSFHPPTSPPSPSPPLPFILPPYSILPSFFFSLSFYMSLVSSSPDVLLPSSPISQYRPSRYGGTMENWNGLVLPIWSSHEECAQTLNATLPPW